MNVYNAVVSIRPIIPLVCMSGEADHSAGGGQYLSGKVLQRSFWTPFARALLSSSESEGARAFVNLWAERRITRTVACLGLSGRLTCKGRSCCPGTDPASCLCRKLWSPPPQTRHSPAGSGTRTPLWAEAAWHLQPQPHKKDGFGQANVRRHTGCFFVPTVRAFESFRILLQHIHGL